jgi:predicted nucleic acid-binding protein
LTAERGVAEIGRHLEERPAEEAGIAAITASELLPGVHRATAEHRARRVAAGWRVATASTRHFERIPGLNIIGISLTNSASAG